MELERLTESRPSGASAAPAGQPPSTSKLGIPPVAVLHRSELLALRTTADFALLPSNHGVIELHSCIIDVVIKFDTRRIGLNVIVTIRNLLRCSVVEQRPPAHRIIFNLMAFRLDNTMAH